MNKKEYRKQRADWRASLAAGLVVNYPELNQLTAFPDTSSRDNAVKVAGRSGIKCFIVGLELDIDGEEMQLQDGRAQLTVSKG